MLILGLLGMYFDAAVAFVTKSSLLFRLAVGHTVYTFEKLLFPAQILELRVSLLSNQNFSLQNS